MEPLWDNLKFIQNQYGEKDKEYKVITDSIENEKTDDHSISIHSRAKYLKCMFYC